MASAMDFAWACGLFEGEGYVHHRPATKTGSVTRGRGTALEDLPEDLRIREFPPAREGGPNGE